MIVSDRMNKALNKQITHELDASYNYLAMSAAFHDMGLKIFAKRFANQSEEERGHALKIIGYLQDVHSPVQFDALNKPKSDYATAAAVVKTALDSELVVTRQINDLVALAESEKDYTTRGFLHWFVNEQIEEVSSMQELLQWVEMAGDKNLFVLENRLAATMK